MHCIARSLGISEKKKIGVLHTWDWFVFTNELGIVKAGGAGQGKVVICA